MYKRTNPRTGQEEKVFSLKDKYLYYKNKANSTSSVNKQGKKIGFTGRVELANRANYIKRRMGVNKKRYESYTH